MSPRDPDTVRQLAPQGRIRAAINLGNPVLARLDTDGRLSGISVLLARALAQRLKLPLELISFDAAGKVFDALREGAWDVAFLAIDPARAEAIDFTPPYVIIEGGYLVKKSAPLQHIDDVDRDGTRIAVGKGSAYDLFLSRAIRHATLVRHASGEQALAAFRGGGLDVLAGVKSPLLRAAESDPGLRVLPGAFMQIEQAMGVPRGRSGVATYLCTFLEALKASGFVAEALARTGQFDARVAPPAACSRGGA
jgi:polar amino acid transport system substrate-binding protein